MPHKHEISMKNYPFVSGPSSASAVPYHGGLGNDAMVVGEKRASKL